MPIVVTLVSVTLLGALPFERTETLTDMKGPVWVESGPRCLANWPERQGRVPLQPSLALSLLVVASLHFGLKTPVAQHRSHVQHAQPARSRRPHRLGVQAQGQ